MNLLKSLLSIQLCLVFSVSQAYALSGGPDYGSAASFIGDYSGSLVGGESTVTGESNALGLFSLGIPSVGLASGPASIFSNGRVFTGSIQALATPEGNLDGVINTFFSFTVIIEEDTGDGIFDDDERVNIDAQATGSIQASISSEESVASTGNQNTVRINGTASLDISGGETDVTTGAPIIIDQINFVVTGYQQSGVQSISSNFGTAIR